MGWRIRRTPVGIPAGPDREAQYQAERIKKALNPEEVSHGPVTTLKEMSPEKREEMERLYGKGPAKKP